MATQATLGVKIELPELREKPEIRETAEGLLVCTFEVLILYGLTWSDWLRLGAPQTSRFQQKWAQMQIVSEQYQLPTRGEYSKFSIATFSKSWPYQWGIDHAAKKGWQLATPCEVLAIGRQAPKLNQMLGTDSMLVSSLISCNYRGLPRFPELWYYNDRRTAELTYSGATLASEDYDPSSGREWFAVRGNAE